MKHEFNFEYDADLGHGEYCVKLTVDVVVSVFSEVDFSVESIELYMTDGDRVELSTLPIKEQKFIESWVDEEAARRCDEFWQETLICRADSYFDSWKD